MNIKLSIVTSANGFSTNGKEGPSKWASPEDQQKFADLKAQSDVVAMGSNTYRGMREFILNNLTEKPMRAVIHRGHDFRLDTVPGKLEFYPSIEDFLEDMRKRQKSEILLASGAALNGEFFRRGLIDEVHQTVEPVYFEDGLPIATGIQHIPLRMRSEYPVRLNEQGTVYAIYDVIKGVKK